MADVLDVMAIPLQLPCAFRTCRHMKRTCGLIGCTLRASLDDLQFCSADQRQIAEANSKGSNVFHYFDGFSPVAEQQDESCFVAIIKAMNGMNVGIPTFVINVHLEPPWKQKDKFFTDLKADWLFFTTDFRRMPAMHVLLDNVTMAWRPLTKRQVLVSGVPVQNKVTVLPYNQNIISSPVTKEQSLLVQGWKL